MTRPDLDRLAMTADAFVGWPEAQEYGVRYGTGPDAELVLDKSWRCVADVVASYHGGFAEGGRVTGVLVTKTATETEWTEVPL